MIGTYYYYCTFVDQSGLETNPGPVSQAVTATDGAVLLSAIPICPITAIPDMPPLAKRRIYRTGGQLGAAYQVTEIADNVTTTYLDG